MLVLEIRKGEFVDIGEGTVKLVYLRMVKNGNVRLGFEADIDIPIVRSAAKKKYIHLRPELQQAGGAQ